MSHITAIAFNEYIASAAKWCNAGTADRRIGAVRAAELVFGVPTFRHKQKALAAAPALF